MAKHTISTKGELKIRMMKPQLNLIILLNVFSLTILQFHGRTYSLGEAKITGSCCFPQKRKKMKKKNYAQINLKRFFPNSIPQYPLVVAGQILKETRAFVTIGY